METAVGVLSSRRGDIEEDYGKTLKRLLREAKFNSRPAAINSKNFSFQVQPGRKEKVFIKLFSFGPRTLTEIAFQEMAKKRWRQLDIREALTLAAQHPDLQIERPIVVLGANIVSYSRSERRYALYLDGSAVGRYVCLADWGQSWNELCQFAGARKRSTRFK